MVASNACEETSPPSRFAATDMSGAIEVPAGRGRLSRMAALLGATDHQHQGARAKGARALAAFDEQMLPSGWSTASDSQGRIYYYNRTTCKSQWKYPEEPAERIRGRVKRASFMT